MFSSKKSVKELYLPSCFTLAQGRHTAMVIRFLRKLMSGRNKNIHLNFSKVEEMTVGDFIVLAAQAEKAKLNRKNECYKTKHLTRKKDIDAAITRGLSFHHNQVAPFWSVDLVGEKAEKVVGAVVEKILMSLKKIGIRDDFGLFGFFLNELMTNAVEHGIRNGRINWWLTYEVDNKTNTITYTFVDMGLGIISSHKKAGLPFKYRFLPNKRIPIDAFKKKLPSSTKQTNRGKGLPQILSFLENDYFSNFVLITNSVALSFEDKKFITKKVPDFIGTYYTWTINKENYKKWKNL